MGYFIVDGKKFENRFVNAGRMYVLDLMWRIADWNSTPSITMRVGSSTNTGNGVVGPTNSSTVSTDSGWSGVDPNDFNLTSEIGDITMGDIQIVRSGKTVHIYATLTNNNATDSYDVYEIGLFLGSGVPVNDPSISSNPTDMENVMIVRGIRYWTINGGADYTADCITFAPSESKNIAYVFNDFEG